MPQSNMENHNHPWDYLYKLGKQSFTPGGKELTEKMVELININTKDKIVEYAPGLGNMSRILLQYKPLEYTAIDNNKMIANYWSKQKKVYAKAFRQAPFWETGKNKESISKSLGENFLITLTQAQQQQLLEEAAHITKVGGLLGLHEIVLADSEEALRLQDSIQKELSMKLQHPVKIRSKAEWLELLKKYQFDLHAEAQGALQTTKTRALLNEENWFRNVTICCNWLIDKTNRSRLQDLIHTLKKYEPHLKAQVLVAIRE